MEKNKKSQPSLSNEQQYFVKGMHCASCEVLIEKKLLTLNNVKAVEASNSKNEVTIEYSDEKPALDDLDKLFKDDGYKFSVSAIKNVPSRRGLFSAFLIFLTLLVLFFILSRFGLGGFLDVSATSSLPTFFLFGLLAGVSSCAALVGGVILSMSKQWSALYSRETSFVKKSQPQLLFNIGRLVSYIILGGILGAIGSAFQLSLNFTSGLVILISVIMLFLGLQMLGVKKLQRFQLTLPKFITRYIANEKNFQGKYLPSVLGDLTFFLPCGFTLTAQSLALLSGNILQGSLIMFIFALGTLPSLLVISFSSVHFLRKPHLSTLFLNIAGFLVLFFGLYNINAQLNVLGIPNISDFFINRTQEDSLASLPEIVDGKQVVTMEASAKGYDPNYFTVQAGIPVTWQIDDVGTSGCTNVIISKDLFDGEIPLTPGEIATKEFLPEEHGIYKFSCWMGMVSGAIEVVDKETNQFASEAEREKQLDEIEASSSCGCGCG